MAGAWARAGGHGRAGRRHHSLIATKTNRGRAGAGGAVGLAARSGLRPSVWALRAPRPGATQEVATVATASAPRPRSGPPHASGADRSRIAKSSAGAGPNARLSSFFAPYYIARDTTSARKTQETQKLIRARWIPPPPTNASLRPRRPPRDPPRGIAQLHKDERRGVARSRSVATSCISTCTTSIRARWAGRTIPLSSSASATGTTGRSTAGTSRSSGGQTGPSRCAGPGRKTVFDRKYRLARRRNAINRGAIAAAARRAPPGGRPWTRLSHVHMHWRATSAVTGTLAGSGGRLARAPVRLTLRAPIGRILPSQERGRGRTPDCRLSRLRTVSLATHNRLEKRKRRKNSQLSNFAFILA